MSNIVVEILKQYRDIERFYPLDLDEMMISNEVDIDELLVALIRVQDRCEEQIQWEYKNLKFITDDFKLKVSRFCTLLMTILIKYHSQLKESYHYQALLSKRHIGYGFYSLLSDLIYDANDKENYTLAKSIYDNDDESDSSRILYLSLCDYYINYFGNFHNNETAIERLCAFYNSGFKFTVEEDKVVAEALQNHISNAGDYGDSGYAFNGLRRIREHIQTIPQHVVQMIIEKYDVHMVLSNRMSRKQIYNLIMHSTFESQMKYKLKFFYIDSIMLTKELNKLIRKTSSNIVSLFMWGNEKLGESELVSFEKQDDESRGYWKTTDLVNRLLVHQGSTILEIELTDFNRISIRIPKRKVIDIDFDENDYYLDLYSTLEFENKLSHLFSEVDEESVKEPNSRFTFSYLYLNNYRSLSSQSISFDHKFVYDPIDNGIMISCEGKKSIDNFYDNKVYSTTCIVGRNGTGKTSIIDFLKESFFNTIELITIGKLNCVKGQVASDDCYKHGILEKIHEEESSPGKKTEFLVVFNYEGKSYYLTNMHLDKCLDVEPYSKDVLANDRDLSKVIYFSNMIDSYDGSFYENISSEQKLSDKRRKSETYIENHHFIDFSEKTRLLENNKAYMASSSLKLEALTDFLNESLKKEVVELKRNETLKVLSEDYSVKTINTELFYQLCFLDSYSAAELKYLFDRDLKKELVIPNEDDSKNPIKISVLLDSVFKEDANDEILQKLIDIINRPYAKLNYFSSGQYAKFSFLARLHWCLNGYRKYYNFFERLFGKNILHESDTIRKGDTVMLFIDEGELYYHPEWQRAYVSTLMSMIKESDVNAQIQIVITSNSPFIISDVLHQDVAYLPGGEKEQQRTFGQNIHTLLKSNFFVSHTIGEFSRARIDFIIGVLNYSMEMKHLQEAIDNNAESSEELKYARLHTEAQREDLYRIHLNLLPTSVDIPVHIKTLIEPIGEIVYREKLTMMFHDCFSEFSELQKLEIEKEKLEKRIGELKERV